MPSNVRQQRLQATPKVSLEEASANYQYDYDRFIKWSSAVDINEDIKGLEAFLVSAAHSLEKGFSMPNAKPRFGLRKIPIIVETIKELEAKGYQGYAIPAAKACLVAYINFHQDHQFALAEETVSLIHECVSEWDVNRALGGSKTLTRIALQQACQFDYDQFIHSRYSVRQYLGTPVAEKDIALAVSRALKTPRTCNRESRNVYFTNDPEVMKQALALHSGNRGFGDTLGALLVVTSDLRDFDMIGERNQGWIDGGLFAMSLVYALHAKALGTCMLNWSTDRHEDERFRQSFNIPDHEVIITLVGVGHVPEQFDVAVSEPPSVETHLKSLQKR